MPDSDSREFPLAAFSSRGMVLSALLLIVVPWLIVAGSIVAQGGRFRDAASGFNELSGPLVCAVAWAVLALASRRRRLTLAGGMLTVRSTFYRADVPVAALDLAKARLFDREERTELRPRRRRNGVGLPGLQSGHFTLRNGERAFAAVASGRWRLWLPRRHGPGLLLEPENPRALLDALRAEAEVEARTASLAPAFGSR